MSWSSTKRLTKEMADYKEASKIIISPESYYMVHIKLAYSNKQQCELARAVAENELKKENPPTAIYYNSNEVMLIFSCAPSDSAHQLGGCHHSIVSKYASCIAFEHNLSNVDASIILFNSQTQIVTYIGWEITQTMQTALKKYSNGKITDMSLFFKTATELRPILEHEKGTKWDDIPKGERYGTVIKLSKNAKKDNNISSICEQFDAREFKKYTNFIFG